MSSATQEDLTLDALIEELGQDTPKNPYENYFLVSNPFPTLGQFSGICVNQESVKKEFTQALRDVYLGSQSRIMTILGSTGAGKTNLLRFLEQTLSNKRDSNTDRKTITDLFTVLVERPKGSYLEIHRQIINQLAAMFFTEFFSAVRQGEINLSSLPTELSGIHPALIQALDHIAPIDSRQLSLDEVTGQTSFLREPLSYRTLENWLQGTKLSTTEKKQLGNVSAEVGKSSTVAIKFLSDLVRIFSHIGLFKGLVIFIDEFEEVFSGLTPTYQAQYAQDLRNLFDSLSNGVVFVVATAPIAERLQQISPALQRRLGQGVQIAPISDEATALRYASAYMELGRNRFEEKMKTTVSLPANCSHTNSPYYPLTESEVKQVYKKLKDEYPVVIPGDLLPALYHLLYRRVYEEG